MGLAIFRGLEDYNAVVSVKVPHSHIKALDVKGNEVEVEIICEDNKYIKPLKKHVVDCDMYLEVSTLAT